jgi:hypothetical protein
MEIWISLLELLAIVVFTDLILREYAADDVSLEMKALTYIGWLYGFISIALLPFDIYIVTA